MRNIKLVIAYDGTDYRGWQRQSEGTTIQGLIEAAIERLTGAHSALNSAGRTDSGVHALGQVAAFRTQSDLSLDTIRRALNALLPPDVRVLDATEADRSFHPRYSALGKRYLYFILVSQSPVLFVDRYVWHMPYELDLDAMRSAASVLAGQRDFRAFMASGSSVKGTVRNMRELSIEEAPSVPFLGLNIEGSLIRIAVEADGFLRHMVRNIVGTLVDVGQGQYGDAQVQDILNSLDRGRAGDTAPAKGLFMEQVYY